MYGIYIYSIEIEDCAPTTARTTEMLSHAAFRKKKRIVHLHLVDLDGI